MKRRWARILLYAVLVGWCLLFLRCETTEKSMIRVVYLEQKEQTWSVGLLYQSPEAAADAADASAALRIADGRGQTLETALAAAEGTLPQTADYRLCDYLLFPVQTDDGVLSAYEALVLERGCGRTAARLSCTEFDLEILLQSCGKTETLPDKLLDKLKAGSAAMPRLYAHKESLLPVLCLQDEEPEVSGSGALYVRSGAVQRLTENETEAFLLLTGTPGKRTFWLQRKACNHPAVHRLSCSPEADGHPASGLPDGLRHAAAGCGTASAARRTLPWGGTFLLAAGDRPAASAGAQSAVHRLSRRV